MQYQIKCYCSSTRALWFEDATLSGSAGAAVERPVSTVASAESRERQEQAELLAHAYLPSCQTGKYAWENSEIFGCDGESEKWKHWSKPT